jgi:hypothetical protein
MAETIYLLHGLRGVNRNAPESYRYRPWLGPGQAVAVREAQPARQAVSPGFQHKKRSNYPLQGLGRLGSMVGSWPQNTLTDRDTCQTPGPPCMSIHDGVVHGAGILDDAVKVWDTFTGVMAPILGATGIGAAVDAVLVAIGAYIGDMSGSLDNWTNGRTPTIVLSAGTASAIRNLSLGKTLWAPLNASRTSSVWQYNPVLPLTGAAAGGLADVIGLLILVAGDNYPGEHNPKLYDWLCATNNSCANAHPWLQQAFGPGGPYALPGASGPAPSGGSLTPGGGVVLGPRLPLPTTRTTLGPASTAQAQPSSLPYVVGGGALLALIAAIAA